MGRQDDRARPVGRRRRHDPGAGLRTGRAGRLRRSPRGHGRAAQRLRERHLPGHRPGHRSVGAAGAPARIPHRAGDRLRARLDGRAARRGRGAHPAGDARPPTGGAWSSCRTRRHGEQPRTSSRSSRVPGTAPLGSTPRSRRSPAAHFAELGEITARMHRHAREWARPAWFTRFHWDYAAAFGAQAPLGPLAGRHRRRAGRARDPHPAGRRAPRPAAGVRHRAGTFRPGPRRHPAGQPARHDGSVSVIDFDDCGFSWYLYDLGTAVSFFEHDPRSPPCRRLAGGLPAGRDAVRGGRGRDLDVHACSGGCCWSPGSARTGPWTSPPSSAPGTRRAAATLRRSYLSTH